VCRAFFSLRIAVFIALQEVFWTIGVSGLGLLLFSVYLPYLFFPR